MDEEKETNRGNQQAWPPTDGSGLEKNEWNSYYCLAGLQEYMVCVTRLNNEGRFEPSEWRENCILYFNLQDMFLKENHIFK